MLVDNFQAWLENYGSIDPASMSIDDLLVVTEPMDAKEFLMQAEDASSEDTCEQLILAHREGHVTCEQLVRGLKSTYHQQYIVRAVAAKIRST